MMRRIFFARVLVLIVLAVVPVASFGGERVALLIGNSAYARPEMALRNPENDVIALGRALRKLGFRVTEAINQNLDGMEAAVDEFRVTARDADMALFFYAGHGVQVGGDNHLIATDFDAPDIAGLSRASLTMSDVRRAFEQAAPDIGILMLDACRNNPFTDAGQAAQGLVRSKGGAGLLIAYATDPGNVAFDGSGRNSVFTEALLNHIETPGLDARLMLGRVRQQVVLDTNGQQVPWVEEAVLGEHFFAPAKSGADNPDVFAQELGLWRDIANSTDPGDFTAYLADYPDGLFRDFAKDRIALLQTAAHAPAGDATATQQLMAAADPEQVSAALTALGLLSPQRAQTRAVEAELLPALNGYRQQLADPASANVDQLFTDASRVSMFLAATTLQRIRTDIVALRGVDRTLGIATDALQQIEVIAASDTNALPILQSAKDDVAAIRLARANILRRLDHSRSYYDEVLTRAVAFVPKDASAALIGDADRSRDLSQSNRQLVEDANLFLKHISQADEAKKGSYAWLKDIIPQD